MRRSLFAVSLLFPTLASAQDPAHGALAERFIRMTAVTGFEHAALDSVQALFPGARRDRAGNVIVDNGSGPATLIVCPFDEVGYVVGGIRDDGWLTLRRVGARAPNALWDQYHEGQRVTVWGDRGPRPAVVGVRSTHLTRGRSTTDVPFTVDDAVVDIGASNATEARAAGVELLAPVARLKQVTKYGNGLLAGPNAGRRSACAALVYGIVPAAVDGRLVLAFVVEQELGQRGLRTVMNALGPFERTLILDAAEGPPGEATLRADTALSRRYPGLGTVRRLIFPTRHFGTSVETISIQDLGWFRQRIPVAAVEGR